MPWVSRPNFHAACKVARISDSIEPNNEQSSRDLTGRFGSTCLSTQGIGLRPQPWAKISRPVGPVFLGAFGLDERRQLPQGHPPAGLVVGGGEAGRQVVVHGE